MRRLNLIPILATALLLSACASSPQIGASAEVTTDPCGQPVVTATVSGAPAGGGWQTDTVIRVHKPCASPLPPLGSQEPANESTQQEP